MSTSTAGKFTYDGCSYGPASVLFLTPDASAGWNELLAELLELKPTKVHGVGSAAITASGTNAVATTTNGKTKLKTVPTVNLWFFVPGKAIVEISENNGNLSREESLAKAIIPLLGK